jgi:ribosome-binding factor A
MTHRRERVGDLIRDVLSEVVLRESKDPRLQRFFTITEVEISPDLKHARVYVSVMGSREDKMELLRGLEAAQGFLRHELASRTKLRYTPELDFRLDESIERGDRILRLLKEISPGPRPEAQGMPDADGNAEEGEV